MMMMMIQLAYALVCWFVANVTWRLIFLKLCIAIYRLST